MLPAVLENHGGLRLREASGRCHPPCGHAGRPHSRGILPGRGVSPWFGQQRGGKDAQQPGELGRAGTKVLPTPARLSRRLFPGRQVAASASVRVQDTEMR